MQGKRWSTAISFAILFATAAESQSRPRLAGFEAYLFNSKTGRLSQDMLANGAPELGNVRSSEFASVSTLVVVRIELGAEAPVPEKMQIRLTAIEAGSTPFAGKNGKAGDRTLLDKTSTLGPVNEKGISYVGFWLDGTGCRTITLRASIVGAVDASPITRVLPFACYE
jgi:hypothetical protein